MATLKDLSLELQANKVTKLIKNSLDTVNESVTDDISIDYMWDRQQGKSNSIKYPALFVSPVESTQQSASNVKSSKQSKKFVILGAVRSKDDSVFELETLLNLVYKSLSWNVFSSNIFNELNIASAEFGNVRYDSPEGGDQAALFELEFIVNYTEQRS